MPAFNESATIDEIVRRVTALPLRTQLIVVDDASTDGTRESLQRLQQELGFTLLLQPHNQGKGAALRRGFEAVRGDLVVIQDADLVFAGRISDADRTDLPGEGGRRLRVALGRHRVFLFRITWATAC